MSTLLRQERTKSDIPLGHLEYDYIGQCKDPKELEKIIKVLRSGEEGRYPDLEEFAENCLTALNPKSRSLRKEKRVSTPADIDKSEWEAIAGDLSNWSSEMKDADVDLSGVRVRDMEEEEDSNLPPIRGQATITASHPETSSTETKKEKPKKNKRVKPREYREWDKVDVEAELDKIDSQDKPESQPAKAPVQNVLSKPSTPSIPSTIDSTGMSDREKAFKAEKEKDKGNEAFRANDFHEALLYYNRSLSLVSSAAVHNNRAQSYIKLKEWDNAIEDCQTVLRLEPNNLKGLLRRSVAYQGKKQLVNAKNDIQRVLKVEPGNKRALNILKEIEEGMAEQKTKGRRMVIEETDGSSDSENEDNVDAPKPSPIINGSPVNTPSKTEITQPETVSKVEEVKHKAQNSQQQKAATKIPPEAATNDKHKEKAAEKQVSDSKLAGSNKPESKPDQTTTTNPTNPGKKNKKKRRKSNRSQSDSASEDRPAVIKADQEKEENVKKAAEESKEPEATLEKEAQQSAEPPAPEPPAPEPQAPEPAPEPPAPLPKNVDALKTAGNEFFKVGQYGEAVEQYSKAIDKLAKAEGNQTYNMHLLYGNRGLAKLKVGDCEGCVRDCNTALDLQPGSIKPLARRAQAFEAMEKFRRAYVDYRQVVYVDRSVDVAQQGLNRCMKMLQQMDGPKWREKLPDVKVAHLTQTPQTAPETPQPAPETTSSSSTSETTQTTLQPQQTTQSKPSTPTTTQHKVPEMTKDELYDKSKAEGNAYVQKGDFRSAVSCYSSCIEISPEKSVAYVNRALCHLRLNKPEDVIKDCNEGLKLEPSNIKALFRRAQGYKMLEKYDESYHDLTSLLKKDPKNASARKELLVVMKYRDQAMKAKAQKRQKEEEEKKRHRMKIQEVSDSDSSDEEPFKPTQRGKPTPTKTGTKKQESPKSKQENLKGKNTSGKNKPTTAPPKDKKSTTVPEKVKEPVPEPQKEQKPEVQPQDEKNLKTSKTPESQSAQEKKETSKESKIIEEIPENSRMKDNASPETVTSSSNSEVSEPSTKKIKPSDKDSEVQDSKSSFKPTLSSATAYEFVKAWTGLRGRKDVEPFAHLIDQIEPDDLHKVISNKLDSDMLHMMIRCFETFIDKGQLSRSLAYLQNLVTVPRFNMVTMFMGKTEKADLERVFGKLSEGATCPLLLEDLKKLRTAFEM